MYSSKETEFTAIVEFQQSVKRSKYYLLADTLAGNLQPVDAISCVNNSGDITIHGLYTMNTKIIVRPAVA